jgi:putative two-component system hydrogenase maturation factor HypX/HoxX
MRLLLLTHSFNSLAQRLYVELAADGHELSVELDVNDDATAEAVALYRPDVILAPFLKRAIPERIWRKHLCLIVHPGIPGDRGPSSLDWAILEGEREWGVTVLQATEVLDGGPVWATECFPMRAARKSSLYRNEVTETSVRAVRVALQRVAGGDHVPRVPDYSSPIVRGRPRPRISQTERAIDWTRDATATILRKIRASDGAPGVLDRIGERWYHLYDAHPEETLGGTVPGAIIAQRNGAILRATLDGAVWIGRLKPAAREGEQSLKLPATVVLGPLAESVPEVQAELIGAPAGHTYKEIWYEEANGVGYLHFEFHNGAMSTEQCVRLRRAFEFARRRDTRVIVLMGGTDFWSNGIHLTMIEAAPSPADESWANINAMNDLCHAILTTDTHLTISAMQGNAGAGGVFLALAADQVLARSSVVLNSHYKGMGNLFGSEYWTYLMPKRVGAETARRIMERRLPMGTAEAAALGLIDRCLVTDNSEFRDQVRDIAESLARAESCLPALRAKNERRAADEREKPLARYREEELAQMHLNFYGFDPSYHVARYHFVYKLPHAWTPLHLARHRRLAWRRALENVA